MNAELRSILDKHGRLGVPATGLDEAADLFRFGLDSIGIVNVMLAVESEFDVEFPDALLTRQTFSSIASITRVVRQLQSAPV
ncbi:MAG: acyl carrier protein [Acidisphaera sp.]|nr:acyl carrier protein [Acidisphaera sp.]